MKKSEVESLWKFADAQKTKIIKDYNSVLSSDEDGFIDDTTKSQPLDGQSVQLAVYSCGPEQKNTGYRKHKDAFVIDPNNLEDGQKLRKLTIVNYVNSPHGSKIPEGSDYGALRIFTPTRLYDVLP
mmetsp:Transcript_42704/g.65553  ORF Transcript_42704/g.65553 Transcript_42704/m.65553 type:complete len:126 (-) Transcript_42704:1253-1630(-)|eukprot:CAMPEP_0170506320 /NCGR_PEP_ID=MMETSP0208-20121228/54488_1 /TAXON_ID=197538 /ORGANISM="Strombidium inclinatum, Strain S3" /LENGTH=125 /DNA_ID=CAMNT_0010787775 /DNA_START=366 /DNA_END=743 /DNA_ORIENTATION=+